MMVDDTPGRSAAALVLNDAERDALADVLRKYGEERTMIAADVLDYSEFSADIQGDPTLAFEPREVIQERWEHAVRGAEEMEEACTASGGGFHELARTVEKTGQLDLADETTRYLVTEAIDNTGWSMLSNDGFLRPRPGMERVVAAVEGVDLSQQQVQDSDASQNRQPNDPDRAPDPMALQKAAFPANPRRSLSDHRHEMPSVRGRLSQWLHRSQTTNTVQR